MYNLIDTIQTIIDDKEHEWMQNVDVKCMMQTTTFLEMYRGYIVIVLSIFRLVPRILQNSISGYINGLDISDLIGMRRYVTKIASLRE